MVTKSQVSRRGAADRQLQGIGAIVIRYGLALVLVWVGVIKFSAYEAEAIQPFVANSPFMSWLYDWFSVSTLSALLGVVEISLGLLIATRSFAPRASAAGSIGASFMFIITLSFMLTTPGIWQPGYGFPFLGAGGGFLVKDVLLLGAAVWTAGEALGASAGAGLRETLGGFVARARGTATNSG
jgi:uncharacterized membrane protein YkgB